MIHIYKPNKAVKGFACSFWYSNRDESLFATIIKQSGWDAEKGNGVFKANKNDPNGKTSIKLSFVEAAAILDCIERNRPFNTFHDGEDKPKSIGFVPWLRDTVQVGYSFSITVGDKTDKTIKNSFYIGLTFAEARLIREFIIWVTHFYFSNRASNEAASHASLPQLPQPETIVSESEETNNPAPEESKSVVDPLLDF